MERHTTFFVGDLKPLNLCGKTIGYEADVSAYEVPFEINPTEGEHDFNKCDGCKANLPELIKRLNDKFEGYGDVKKAFPNCCPTHSQLVNVKEFKIADFTNVPETVAKKIIYTKQHIINNHNSENWYKKITDYIEYTVESFGKMPTGCGEPLYLSEFFKYIPDLFKGRKDIPTDKKTRILEYLNSYQLPNKKAGTDFNILLNTYESWLKIFPFEISYFSHLKQYFEKQLPISNGKMEVNLYSGVAKTKMHTKVSLIEALIGLTNDLITQLNGLILHEKGQLTDPQKIKMELIINSRKMKLKQGYSNSSPNEEQRYRNILQEWFKDEKKFIDEISPVMKELPTPPVETKTDKLKNTLCKFGFLNLPMVKDLTPQQQEQIIVLLSSNKLPYQIAMIDYLGFIKYIEKEHFQAKYKLHKELSKWFDSDKEGRAVKANISCLLENSTENKNRYTAHLHKETVKKDYEQLK
ncbi:MAG: hypothetical protein Q8L90_11540 [Bacteroidota bacterium]|nr:hypothetical protein [Bacteroidota bacterium]